MIKNIKFNHADPESIKDERLVSWSYNVLPHLKHLSKPEIQDYCKQNSKPYGILMENLLGDFNFASVIRSANAFGAEKIFYYGKKKFDRRGACGTHHYVNLNFFETFEDVLSLKEEYTFVALENVSRTSYLHEFSWDTYKKPLIILGEEGSGISEQMLDLCDHQIEIKQLGSVPSVNAAVAASIAMSDLLSKRFL